MRQRRFLHTAALVAALGIGTGLAAARWSGRVAQAAQAESAASAQIDTFQFTPRELEVKAGTKVVWTNNDDVTHTVTAGVPEQRSQMFDGALNGKSMKFEFTFTRTGTFAYFCNRHQHMRGEIKVRD